MYFPYSTFHMSQLERMVQPRAEFVSKGILSGQYITVYGLRDIPFRKYAKIFRRFLKENFCVCIK